MRVIPRGAVCVGNERVREGFSRRNRALSYTRYTVHPRRALLQEAMPVYRCPISRGLDVILDFDFDRITPIFAPIRKGSEVRG